MLEELLNKGFKIQIEYSTMFLLKKDDYRIYLNKYENGIYLYQCYPDTNSYKQGIYKGMDINSTQC